MKIQHLKIIQYEVQLSQAKGMSTLRVRFGRFVFKYLDGQDVFITFVFLERVHLFATKINCCVLKFTNLIKRSLNNVTFT